MNFNLLKLKCDVSQYIGLPKSNKHVNIRELMIFNKPLGKNFFNISKNVGCLVFYSKFGLIYGATCRFLPNQSQSISVFCPIDCSVSLTLW